MIVDRDANGKIAITELTHQQAEVLQEAAIFLAEKQQPHSDPSRFLRRLAIRIDRLLPKPLEAVATNPHPDNCAHLFIQRNHKQ